MTRLDLATEEDEKSGLVKWVKLFKAKTWEEMKMIAENDIDILEATDNLYLSNADQTARDIAWHRQERIYLEKREKAEKERLTKALEESVATIAEKDATIAEKNTTIAERDTAIAESMATIAEKNTTIAESMATIAEKDTAIADLELEIVRLKAELAAEKNKK